MDWRKALAGLAPALASGLEKSGVPGLNVLGMVGEALLGRKDASEGDVEAALSQGLTGEQRLALVQQDRDYALAVKDRELAEFKATLEDKANARAREATVRDAWWMHTMSGAVLVAFFGAAAAILFGKVTGLHDPAVAGVIGSVIGFLSAKANTVIEYYFGSSSSSRAKDDTISALGKK